MNTFSRIIKTILTVGLLAASSASFAIPTLNFGATLNYDTTGFLPADLNITGSLTGFQDITLAPQPDLATSSFSLFADLLSVASDTYTTTGTFGTAGVGNDLLIMDSSSTRTLLTGTVQSMLFSGPNGFNLGNMTGSILLTGGLLDTQFGGAGALVAFNFNLSTVFGSTMFDTSFSGVSNGSIEGTPTPVPEPMPLALLSLGLIGITLTRKVCKRS
jgi:hypothetical protein